MPRLTSVFRHMRADVFVDDTILFYIYNKTILEVLKEIDYTEIDYELSHQYATFYNVPWKDCPIQIEKFKNNYPHILYTYILTKSMNSLKKVFNYISNVLVKELDMTKFVNFQKVHLNDINKTRISKDYRSITMMPLTGAIVDQLDVIIESGKMLKNANKYMGRYINETYYGNLKQICSKIEMADKMMQFNFIGLGNKSVLTSGDESYLRKDQLKSLLDLATVFFSNSYNNVNTISQRDLYFDTIRLITYILSILLHTFKPNEMITESSNDLYKRYVEESINEINSNNIFQFIREYTNKSLAFVIELPFNSCSYSGYCKNHPERRNEIASHSLQERYLVLYFFLDIICKFYQIPSSPSIGYGRGVSPSNVSNVIYQPFSINGYEI